MNAEVSRLVKKFGDFIAINDISFSIGVGDANLLFTGRENIVYRQNVIRALKMLREELTASEFLSCLFQSAPRFEEMPVLIDVVEALGLIGAAAFFGGKERRSRR
ncbi:MAG: hypothetical protein LUP95_06165 [Euryarchaeota archaeon]|nr:hypothetical protein [Euryarchaeota archaeon]